MSTRKSANHDASEPSSPKARLVVRVGVTGHRSLDEQCLPAIRDHVRSVLEQVRELADRTISLYADAFTSGPPVLRVISSLAQGVDQLVAEEALRLGFELQCPLPFLRDEYRRDFEGSDRTRFDRLLEQATAVLELDGSRENAPAAYEACSRVMLDQSDLIIAVWDGKAERGQGGTGKVVAEADELEIPVVWVNATGSDPIQMNLCEANATFCPLQREQFQECLIKLLLPPSEGRSAAHEYFSKLRSGGRSTESTKSPAREHENSLASVIAPYQHHFQRTDQLAIRYTRRYRVSYLCNYLLAALAASLAIFLLYYEGHTKPGASDGDDTTYFLLLGLEGALLLTIVVLTVWAIRQRWHGRAINYRFLAEQFRLMFFLNPLGLVTPESRPPFQYSDGDPRSTWMNWLFRSVVRQIGLPHAAITPEYIAAYRQYLLDEAIGSQVLYHERLAKEKGRRHSMLHGFAIVLFVAAAIVIILHIALLAFQMAEHGSVLTVITALCPAWGGALLAIDYQGEYGRVARRSKAMVSHLSRIIEVIENHAPQDPSSRLVPLVRSAARSMIDEVMDWRIVFQARPTSLPA